MGTSSFSDLNNFGNEMVSFTDDRDFAVTITGDTSTSNSINANEGDTISFLWNQTLTELISPVALPSTANLTIEIDLSNALAPQDFDWGTLPSGVTTSTPSTNVHRVTGILTIADLNTLLTNASCEIVDQESTFSYTVKVIYNLGAGDVEYTTTNSVSIVTTYPEITVPATAWAGDVIQGKPGGVDITGVYAAETTDTETSGTPTYTWTVTCLTSRVTDMSSTGGGSASTATVGSNTVRTITGTKAQVNAHLSSLNLTLANTFGTLNVNYQCTNVLSGVISTGVSTGSVVEVTTFENVPSSIAYTRNAKLSDIFSTFAVSSDVDTYYGDSNYKVRIFVGGGTLTGQLSGNASLTAGETITQANTGATGVQTVDTETATTMTLQYISGTWSTDSNDTITGSDSGSHSVYLSSITSQPEGDESNTENTDDIGWVQDVDTSDPRAYHMIEKTGTTAELNTWLQNKINYIPIPNSINTNTLTVKLYRTNGTLIKEAITIAMTGSGTSTVTDATLVYNDPTNLDPAAWEITDTQRFFLRTDILVVGAGGTEGGSAVALTGGTGTDPQNAGGGGAGAGEYTYITRSKLFNGYSGLSYIKSTVGDTGWPATITFENDTVLVVGDLIIQYDGSLPVPIELSRAKVSSTDGGNVTTCEIVQYEDRVDKTPTPDFIVQGVGEGHLTAHGGHVRQMGRCLSFSDTVQNTESTINFRPTSGGADTLLIQSNNGGAGASAVNSTTGVNGASGGYGGGGAGGNPNLGTATYGTGGAAVDGQNNVTVYTGGAIANSSSSGYPAQAPCEVGGSVVGGSGGGGISGILNDITGTSVRYCYPGKGGGQGTTCGQTPPPTSSSLRTPGSGGHGQADPVYTSSTLGSDGIIAIKMYNFPNLD